MSIPLNWEEADWVSGIFTKICVYVNSEEELLALKEKADKLGVASALVTDNGQTEFHGIPTHTVLAIGPADSESIDPITGELPLL